MAQFPIDVASAEMPPLNQSQELAPIAATANGEQNSFHMLDALCSVGSMMQRSNSMDNGDQTSEVHAEQPSQRELDDEPLPYNSDFLEDLDFSELSGTPILEETEEQFSYLVESLAN